MALRFTWNGAPAEAEPGDSIAAALAAAGVRAFGRARSGRQRGPFCGMGICQECLVTVDGRRAQRACLTEVAAGMDVRAQHDDDAIPDPAAWRPAVPAAASAAADLVIVGAGPAGLEAAVAARAGGLSVIVLDERGETGGQYFKPRSPGFRGGQTADAQHRAGLLLRQEAEASGALFRCGEAVWFARAAAAGFELRTLRQGATARIAARALILAGGAFELPAMVPGWTRPGVMTIGAAQTLVRRYGVAPGARVLVAGHGPLGMQLAAELLATGARVVAVAERARLRPGPALAGAALAAPGLVRDGLALRLALARAGVPLFAGWELAAVTGEGAAKGEGAVTGARLRRLADGAFRELATDAVCAGDGFAPQVELARLLGVPVCLDAGGQAVPERGADGATAVAGLWIAGDAGGLGGAQRARAEGRLAAVAALRHLGRAVPPALAAAAARAGGQAARAARFQSALWRLYAAPPRALPDDEVVVCRCEEVTAGAVRAAIAAGAGDVGAVKRATRLGMGRCQGRYCTAATLRLLAAAGRPQPAEALLAPQLPARPLPLAALAVEKPEWSGHRDARPAARPAVPPRAPLAAAPADLAIIGAGITGIAAALEAAQAGAAVIVLDRGLVNGEASGGNAGSLHLQLLSWDFGARAVAGGSPQLATLPLQKESIALWAGLERMLGADFEMEITGGLMVAEDAGQMAFLRAKAAAEAAVGIATEVIGVEEIRRIVPAISPRIVAAAWCPGEGKINPLAATPALARAARAAGARIEEQTPVTGLAEEAGGFRIETPRGPVAARRVLIAAGGWSAQVAAMLGVALPVRGAPLQMIVTEPGPPLVPCLIAHADRHLTMKQTRAGTVLIGGAWTATTGAAGQPLVLPDSLEGNSFVAALTVPAVAGLCVVRSWAAMNIDIDGAPLVGPLPGHPGLTVAATANGYTLGPLIGREAARIALTGRTRRDMAAFAIDRFG